MGQNTVKLPPGFVLEDEEKKKGSPLPEGFVLEKKEGQPDPSIMENILRYLPQGVGATAGGIMGGAIGGPPGAAIGAGLGGSLGYLSEKAPSGYAGEDPLSLTGKTLQAGAMEAGGEMIGGASIPLINAALAKVRPFRKTLTDAGEEAFKFFKEFFPKSRVGPNLSQATESRVLDMVSNATEGAITGGQVGRLTEESSSAASELASKQFKMIADVIPDEELGEVLIDTIKGRFKVAKAPAVALLNEVLEKAGKLGVEKEPILRSLRPHLAEIRIASAKFQDSTIDAIYDRLQKASPANPFNVEEAIDVVQRLKELQRSLGRGTPASTKVSRVTSIMERQLNRELAAKDPLLVKKLAKSNDIFRGAYERYQPEFYKTIMTRALKSGAPEMFVRRVLRDPDAASHIKQLKSALGETPQWDLFRANVYADLLSDATLTSGKFEGQISGEKLLRILEGIGPGKKYKGFSEQALNEVFKPDEMAFMRRLGRVLNTIQEKESEGIGKMAIQLYQAGAVGAPLAAVAAGGAGMGSALTTTGGLLLLPWIAGRIITSPGAREAMLNGLKLPQTAKAAGSLTARLAAIMQQMSQKELEVLGDPIPTPAEQMQQPNFGLSIPGQRQMQ